MEAIDMALRPYRRHEKFTDHYERIMGERYEELVIARNLFIEAAHKTQHSRQRAPFSYPYE
jgi:hypothetical protein